MHQDHNIPWHLVVTHLKFTVPKSGDRTKMDFFPTEKATQTSDLRHFARKFASSIAEFSKTERAKFPKAFPTPPKGQVIPDDIYKVFDDVGAAPTGSKCLLIEDWITRARVNHYFNPDEPDSNLYYTTRDGCLADVVKLMLSRPDQAPLLLLANHPQVPIPSLRYLSWGHSFGFGYAAETPLGLYILLNALHALYSECPRTPEEILASQRTQRLLRWVATTMDYDAQNALQWRYFGLGGCDAKKVLEDVRLQREYMKEAWAVFYRYDMLLRECGVDPKWEEVICESLEIVWGFRGLVVHNW